MAAMCSDRDLDEDDFPVDGMINARRSKTLSEIDAARSPDGA